MNQTPPRLHGERVVVELLPRRYGLPPGDPSAPMLATKFPALVLDLTLLLAIVPTLQGGPRILRTLLVEAPQDFSLEDAGHSRRLETFPSKPVDSIDSPRAPIGAADLV